MSAARLCIRTTACAILFLATGTCCAQNCAGGSIHLKGRVDSRFPGHSILVYENDSNVAIRVRLYGSKGLGTGEVVYSSLSLGPHGVATMNLAPDTYMLSWFAEDLDTRANEREDQNVLQMGAAGRLYMASSAVGASDARLNLEFELKPNTRTLLSFAACDTAAEAPGTGGSTNPAMSASHEEAVRSTGSRQDNSGQAAQILPGSSRLPPRLPSPIRDCSAISSSDKDLVPLAAACEIVKGMDRGLPNFFCDQTTQQYYPIGPGHRDPEQRRDDDTIQSTVNATVTYENGVDQYSNIRFGDQPAQSAFVGLSRPITTGDFASVLLSIFRREDAATFSFYDQSNGPDGKEYVFNFKIPAATNQAFTLYENGSSTHPDVSGALWISAESHQVSRLDILASRIDPAFSSDHVRFSTVFGKVQFGDAGDYFLPQQSETVVCTRRGLCTHSVTQWANCKRLAAKSRIIFKNY